MSPDPVGGRHNNKKLRCFKSSEYINEKRDGPYRRFGYIKKVQVGNDQENAQSEKDSHSKNRGGKKPN